MKDKDVLRSLGVSGARLKELIKAKADSNFDTTATAIGITSDSLRALLDPKALMHDDAINRFCDLLEEDRKSSGHPFWAVGVPLMQALESGINGEEMLHDYTLAREANTQGECIATELVQGDCIMAVHVPGHYRGRVEVADQLGLGSARNSRRTSNTRAEMVSGAGLAFEVTAASLLGCMQLRAKLTSSGGWRLAWTFRLRLRLLRRDEGTVPNGR